MTNNSKPRDGELIGGGHFVFRRGRTSGRIGVSHYRLPFEHPTFTAAFLEASRLAAENPTKVFGVFSETATTVGKDANNDS